MTLNIDKLKPQIIQIFHNYRELLNLSAFQEIEIELLGRGESNTNVLITIDKFYQYNLRICHRPGVEVNLQKEFEALRLAPPKVSPHPFMLDLSKKILPHPYSILSFLKGNHLLKWSSQHLHRHAQQLAKLHTRKYNFCGEIGGLQKQNFDFLQLFENSLNYWKRHHPDLLQIRVIAELLPPIQAHLKRHNPLFNNLKHFSLVHGDAHKFNILIHNAEIKYIDWEWAHIGDGAEDVAKVGWPVATHWQMELDNFQWSAYLNAYLVLHPDKTLEQRCRVWIIYFMFFDQLYHRTQTSDTTESMSCPHAFTVQQIEKYLVNEFL